MESPLHLDTMGIVNQAIEDAVGQRRIAYLLVPPRPPVARLGLSNAPGNGPRKSSRSRGRGFQQRSHSPVVDYQNVNAGKPGQ